MYVCEEVEGMTRLKLVPVSIILHEVRSGEQSNLPGYGSGHVGSSFSLSHLGFWQLPGGQRH